MIPSDSNNTPAEERDGALDGAPGSSFDPHLSESSLQESSYPELNMGELLEEPDEAISNISVDRWLIIGSHCLFLLLFIDSHPAMRDSGSRLIGFFLVPVSLLIAKSIYSALQLDIDSQRHRIRVFVGLIAYFVYLLYIGASLQSEIQFPSYLVFWLCLSLITLGSQRFLFFYHGHTFVIFVFCLCQLQVNLEEYGSAGKMQLQSAILICGQLFFTTLHLQINRLQQFQVSASTYFSRIASRSSLGSMLFFPLAWFSSSPSGLRLETSVYELSEIKFSIPELLIFMGLSCLTIYGFRNVFGFLWTSKTKRKKSPDDPLIQEMQEWKTELRKWTEVDQPNCNRQIVRVYLEFLQLAHSLEAPLLNGKSPRSHMDCFQLEFPQCRDAGEALLTAFHKARYGKDPCNREEVNFSQKSLLNITNLLGVSGT